MLYQVNPEKSFRKERGAIVVAFAQQNFEGFHITLEFDDPDTGNKYTRSGMLAHDEASAREFIASEVAKYGFSAGDCRIAWKRG